MVTKRALIATMAATTILLGACGGSGDEATTDPAPAKTEKPKAEKPKAKDIDAKAVVAAFEDGTQTPIADMGDLDTWHPYFNSVDNRNASSITMNLSVPGDYSGDKQENLAERAGIDMFTFAGEAFPKLEQIIVFVDGRDRATVDRSDSPFLEN